MLGPTFSWIIAEQFKALKDGDRFFFTHSNGPNAKGLPKVIQVCKINLQIQTINFVGRLRDIALRNGKIHTIYLPSFSQTRQRKSE